MRRCYVYCGDAKGNIHLLSLTDILKKRDISEVLEK